MTKLNKQVIDDLIKDCKTPEDFFGENGLIKSFVKSIRGSRDLPQKIPFRRFSL
jgi:hypothetical protein